MTTKFKLSGLSIGNRCTIDTLDGKDWFHAPTKFNQVNFIHLFNFCKNDWDNGKIVVVEHDGFYESGKPINPIVIGIEMEA